MEKIEIMGSNKEELERFIQETAQGCGRTVTDVNWDDLPKTRNGIARATVTLAEEGSEIVIEFPGIGWQGYVPEKDESLQDFEENLRSAKSEEDSNRIMSWLRSIKDRVCGPQEGRIGFV